MVVLHTHLAVNSELSKGLMIKLADSYHHHEVSVVLFS